MTGATTLAYVSVDPATGASSALHGMPADDPGAGRGWIPFTGTGAQDGAVVVRPFSQRLGPHLLAPRARLLGWDPRTGAFAYNLSLTAMFYSIAVEAATGDLVGFGLCCSTTQGAWCPKECGDGGASGYLPADNCGASCKAGTRCCKMPTPNATGYCLVVPPPNGTCGDVPATRGQPTFAFLRLHGRGGGAAPAVVATYSGKQLGGVRAVLGAGGALDAATGVYAHAVLLGAAPLTRARCVNMRSTQPMLLDVTLQI